MAEWKVEECDSESGNRPTMLKTTILNPSKRRFGLCVGVGVLVVFATTSVLNPSASILKSTQGWVLVEKPMNFGKSKRNHNTPYEWVQKARVLHYTTLERLLIDKHSS